MAALKKKDDRATSVIRTQTSLSGEVASRPALASDFDFAFRLYRETMKDYTAAYIAWDDDKQKAGLNHQWKQAEISIITLGTTDIGWFAVLESDTTILLGHLYIDPRFQNRGIGSTILNQIIAAARAKRKPVELAVLKNNSARHLYERHGFLVVNEDTMKYFMTRKPGISSK